MAATAASRAVFHVDLESAASRGASSGPGSLMGRLKAGHPGSHEPMRPMSLNQILSAREGLFSEL